MSTRVPAIPAPNASNLLQVAQSVKGVLDVREGLIGDPLDANVTFRDLVDAGIASTKPGFAGSVATLPILPAWSSPDGYDGSTDMTVPDKPTGFTATSGMTSIILQWDAPTSRNHSYAEIWRSATNVIGNAVLLGTSDSRFYTDAVGKTSQTYFYWVRFVSQAGVTGPYNAVGGTSSSTGLVGTADLTDLIISSSKLADSAVTATKIANLAVGNAAIANLAVTNAKIADLAVDNAKIANLDAAKITTGFLSADRIQAGTLDAKIANIDAAVITSGTINTARIADASITGAKIADATITSAKIVSLDATKISATSLSSISANLGSVTAGSISINNKFIVDSAGNATIRSGTTGARVEITNTYIKVFDSSGTLRVQIGDLAA